MSLQAPERYAPPMDWKLFGAIGVAVIALVLAFEVWRSGRKSDQVEKNHGDALRDE